MTGRPVINTTWTGRPRIQSDIGYITTEIGSRLTTETGSKITFHIGIFYDQDTIWNKKRTPEISTVWN